MTLTRPAVRQRRLLPPYAQNYDVPVGARIDGPVTVLVWCRAFGVPVPAATLG